MIKEFLDILETAKTLHEKKSKDYASQSNQFENFERSALLMEWFNDPIDKAFVNLIGTKLARIATLRNNGGKAENEPLADSFFDLTVYCGLWAAYHKREVMEPGFLKTMPNPILDPSNKCEYCGCEFSYTPTIHNNKFFCSDQCGGYYVNAPKKNLT